MFNNFHVSLFCIFARKQCKQVLAISLRSKNAFPIHQKSVSKGKVHTAQDWTGLF